MKVIRSGDLYVRSVRLYREPENSGASVISVDFVDSPTEAVQLSETDAERLRRLIPHSITEKVQS